MGNTKIDGQHQTETEKTTENKTGFSNDKNDYYQVPGLFESEDVPISDKVIYERWIVPGVGFYWLIAEEDEVEELMFGYANLNNDDFAEWGYISIKEIEQIGAMRDLNFMPVKFEEALELIAGKKGYRPLPLVDINGTKYFVDDRLGEFRAQDDPGDRIVYQNIGYSAVLRNALKKAKHN